MKKYNLSTVVLAFSLSLVAIQETVTKMNL